MKKVEKKKKQTDGLYLFRLYNLKEQSRCVSINSRVGKVLYKRICNETYCTFTTYSTERDK